MAKLRKCLDCGKELKDVDMVCPDCGSENLSLIDDNDEKVYKEKKPKGGIIVLIILFIIGVAAGILVYSSSQKSVPAEPVETAIKALYSGDLEGYIDEMYGAFQTDAENYLTSEYGSFEEYSESIKSTLENAYGDDYTIETKVVDVFSYSDKMVEFVNEACDSAGYKADITDLKHITVRVVTKNDEGAQTYYIADDYSAQIGGKWYFLPESMLSSDD